MRAKESIKKKDDKEKALLFLTVMTIMLREHTGQTRLLIRMNTKLKSPYT